MKKFILVIFSILLISACTVADTNNLKSGSDTTEQKNTSTNNINTPTEKREPEENKIVVFDTTLGQIEIEVFNSTMPITAGNFTDLVEKGFYDDVIFHRVIPGFMAQGGDPTGTGRGGPGYTIPDEFTNSNKNIRGTLSMANAGPNTGGSQFFINVADNNFLDTKHPVFGKVISGMDIVDKIVSVKTDSSDKPLTDVVIKSAKIK